MSFSTHLKEKYGSSGVSFLDEKKTTKEAQKDQTDQEKDDKAKESKESKDTKASKETKETKEGYGKKKKVELSEGYIVSNVDGNLVIEKKGSLDEFTISSEDFKIVQSIMGDAGAAGDAK